MRQIAIIVAVAVLIGLMMVVAARPGRAAQCMPVAALESALAGRYGERPAAAGTITGGLVVLAVGAETWTIYVRLDDGRGCIIAAGQGWRAAAEATP